MGGNKRSTGRIYDSLSGHGFIIGFSTNKVIGYGVSKEKCSICKQLNRNNIAAAEAYLNECNINSTGSSGAMESELVLKLTTKIFRESDGLVYVSYIVSNNDSTIQAHLQHKSSGPESKLDDDIHQPSFYADLSRRIKEMSKPIFKMVTNTKDPYKCKQVDALHIKKYTGCAIYKTRTYQ